MTGTPKKVGLALGSGAAKGMAHIGVLVALQQAGIPIDMIAGTSIGAAVGAIYAHTKDATRLKKRILELSAKGFARFLDPALPRNGFIKGNKIKDLLASFLEGNIKFSDLAIPFACVAADIDTGEEMVFDRGSVLDAVRASISIPAVFTVVHAKSRHLVDGGLVNPVPVNVVQQMGADFIIAVNVMPDVAERVQLTEVERKEKHQNPNLVHVVMQSLYIGTTPLVRASLKRADVVIAPDGNVNRAGQAAGQDKMPEYGMAGTEAQFGSAVGCFFISCQ